MSYTRTQVTDMNDQECLGDALTALGYKPSLLQTAESIRGHMSEKTREKCDVVLKKEDTKRGADIGFSKNKDGNYVLVTDTYVNRDLNLEKFAKQVKVEYATSKTKKIAKKAGAKLIRKKVDPKTGETKLIFAMA